MLKNIISFPNLGLGPFEIDPVAFTLFGKKDVVWYGVIIMIGIICGVSYVMHRAKKEKLLEDDVLDYALIVVLTAILFARLYYVIFDPTPNYNTLLSVFAIWEGGLAIYGGIIGGALAVFLVCKWKKVYFARFADMICPAVMIGQIIGRWGNFTNGEAYGSVVKFDFLFWSFDLSSSAIDNPFLMILNGRLAQPTFLYESLWNLVGLLIIVFVINRRRIFAGMTALSYFAWYGFGRMIIEGLRTDSLYIPGSETMRVSQLIGFFTFVFSVVAIVVFSIRAKAHPFDESAPVYYGDGLKKLKQMTEIDAEEPANGSSCDIEASGNVDDEEKTSEDDSENESENENKEEGQK